MTKRIFPPEVCLLPHSDGVQTLQLHLVHPDDVVDAGVEKADPDLSSEVGLRLPEGKVVPTRRPRGIYGNYSPDPAWCASGSTNIVPVIRSSQISLAKHLSIPKRNVFK